jgi:capsular exopolysaccharide synthesis family protein
MLKRLITFNNPKSKASEAFRTLRTNLQFSAIDNDLKFILITSSGASEGKSTILSNLAITYAQAGKKTLILDCDLRKPSIHKQFSLDNSEGLTNYLIGETELEEYIHPTNIPDLYAITSGLVPPNPSELLGMKRMELLLATVQNMFDIVLIDAPPVIAVTDAQVLATMADGVVIITAHGEVEKRALAKTKELLEKVGANILGIVLNRVPDHAELNYYGRNYYYKGFYNGYYTK